MALSGVNVLLEVSCSVTIDLSPVDAASGSVRWSNGVKSKLQELTLRQKIVNGGKSGWEVKRVVRRNMLLG